MKDRETVVMKVKLIRPIRWEGKKLPVGEVLEIPKNQAFELVANGKASFDLKAAEKKAAVKE